MIFYLFDFNENIWHSSLTPETKFFCFYRQKVRSLSIAIKQRKYISLHAPRSQTYALIISMTIEISKQAFERHYYRTRAVWFRYVRLLFPSAAEVRFIKIMGGKIITIPFIKNPETKQPLRFVLDLGKALRNEKFRREVDAGKYWLDFGNDIFWAIEIDGAKFHRDIVREQDKDEYLTEYCHKRCKKQCFRHANIGWRVKHIPAVRLWLEPAVVQSEVLRFLSV